MANDSFRFIGPRRPNAGTVMRYHLDNNVMSAIHSVVVNGYKDTERSHRQVRNLFDCMSSVDFDIDTNLAMLEAAHFTGAYLSTLEHQNKLASIEVFACAVRQSDGEAILFGNTPFYLFSDTPRERSLDDYHDITEAAHRIEFPEVYLPNYATLLRWHTEIDGRLQTRRSETQSELALKSVAVWLRETIGYVPLMWHLLVWYEYGSAEFRNIANGVLKPTGSPSIVGCRSGAFDISHLTRLVRSRATIPDSEHVLVTADNKFADLARCLALDWVNFGCYRIPSEHLADNRIDANNQILLWYGAYLESRSPQRPDYGITMSVVADLERSLFDFSDRSREHPYSVDVPAFVVPAYGPHIDAIFDLAASKPGIERLEQIFPLRFDEYINAAKIVVWWLCERFPNGTTTREGVTNLMLSHGETSRVDFSKGSEAFHQVIDDMVSFASGSVDDNFDDLFTRNVMYDFRTRIWFFRMTLYWTVGIIRVLAMDEAESNGMTELDVLARRRTYFKRLASDGVLG